MSPFKHYYSSAFEPSGAGDLINTHSLEVNGFRFTNTGYSGITNAGVTQTISFWFKIPSSSTGSVIICDVPLDPGAGRARLSLFNSYVFAEFEVSSGGLQRDQYWTNPNGYRDNSWHHLTWQIDGYTYDNSDWTLWVDGVEVGSVLRNQLTSSTPWSVDSGASTTYGNTASVSGAKVAQMAYFNVAVSGVTLYNSGAVFDLNSLATGPVEWYQYAENIDNSGSSGVNGSASSGTASYSTDVPPNTAKEQWLLQHKSKRRLPPIPLFGRRILS